MTGHVMSAQMTRAAKYGNPAADVMNDSETIPKSCRTQARFVCNPRFSVGRNNL